MAQQMKSLRLPILLAFVASLVAILLYVPLRPVEDQITTWRYAVRGEQQADSNIVIIYIDNDAIREIGFPIRRNFHALTLSALSDLKVKAVGLGILFEDPSLEYPEYDQLFAGMLHASRRVALGAYFDSISAVKPGHAQSAGGLDEFDFPFVAGGEWYGSGLHLPLDAFRLGAAGVGHMDLTEDGRIPLYIWHGTQPVPAFGLEVLRLFADADRRSVRYENGEFAVRIGEKLVSIPSLEGAVSLQYPGRISSFTTYPLLEVLKSYDALRSGKNPELPVARLRDKIVIIGVIAEGRTKTVVTPVDPRFPVLGLQATFLDNALRSGFLREVPLWQMVLITFLSALACAASVLLMKSNRRWILPAAVVAGIVLLSFILFSVAGMILPVAMPLAATGLAFVGGLVYRQLYLQKQMAIVRSEKTHIEAALRDREAKVAMLERELASSDSKRSADKTTELLEEIRKYKAEIHTLSSQRDDMEEAAIVELGEAQEFEGIVYQAGGSMQPVIDFIEKIASSDATVLVLGESGTGKEMVARAIHRRSSRADKPFVAVNCGALSENLLESELFGHEKGAFTGAVKDKPGRFEMADGGTILLDEIGEVSEAFQLKLLRVLQEGEFERVGGTKTLKVNIRVIAATNKDLKQLVKEKRFREDLYYRINVLSVELPPLEQRQGDIPILVRHFLKREDGKLGISKNVLDILVTYSWRGNIRELESVITRAVLMAKADKRQMITMKDLSEEVTSAARNTISMEDQILESMREKGFSRSAITETANELGGLNRGTVAEYLRGQFLKAFVENTYKVDPTVRFISHSADTAVNERVTKKLQEYLSNIAEAVDVSRPIEDLTDSLKPKMKNLPQKYHPYLQQIAEAYFRNVWRI